MYLKINEKFHNYNCELYYNRYKTLYINYIKINFYLKKYF